MDSNRQIPSNGKRFSIRTLLGITVIVAISLGWMSSLNRLSRVKAQMIKERDRTAVIEGHIESIYQTKQNERNQGRGFLSGMNLDGCDFAGVTIKTGSSAFQSTTLNDAQLPNANITVGGSSFQSASFDRANLQSATLTATGSSFQIVTFVQSDLRSATLNAGNGAVFQAASFRGADLTGATINCSGISAFQAVDIDSANFTDADLSSIDANNLRTAYFSDPPTYSVGTKFPTGFVPADAGWVLADAP
ncbi:MAG: pentapeptide repeat-containing protein [Pirellulaceae bacterium]|nr:pentapeptide repeat-containing protein [Pirellulaceae bacterium]